MPPSKRYHFCTRDACEYMDTEPDAFSLPNIDEVLDADLDALMNCEKTSKKQFREALDSLMNDAIEDDFNIAPVDGDSSDTFEAAPKTEIEEENEAIYARAKKVREYAATDPRVRRLARFLERKELYRGTPAYNQYARYLGRDCVEKAPKCIGRRSLDIVACMENIDECKNQLPNIAINEAPKDLSEHLELLDEKLEELRVHINDFHNGGACGKDTAIYCESCAGWFCSEECHDLNDPNHGHDIFRVVEKFEFGPRGWKLPGDLTRIDREIQYNHFERCPCTDEKKCERTIRTINTSLRIRNSHLTYCAECTAGNATGCMDEHGLLLLHQGKTNGSRRTDGLAFSKEIVEQLSSRANENFSSYVDTINSRNEDVGRRVAHSDLVDIVTIHQQMNLNIEPGDFHEKERCACMACLRPDKDVTKLKFHCHRIVVDAGVCARDSSKCSDLPEGFKTTGLFTVDSELVAAYFQRIKQALENGNSKAKMPVLSKFVRELLAKETCCEAHEGKADASKDDPNGKTDIKRFYVIVCDHGYWICTLWVRCPGERTVAIFTAFALAIEEYGIEFDGAVQDNMCHVQPSAFKAENDLKECWSWWPKFGKTLQYAMFHAQEHGKACQLLRFYKEHACDIASDCVEGAVAANKEKKTVMRGMQMTNFLATSALLKHRHNTRSNLLKISTLQKGLIHNHKKIGALRKDLQERLLRLPVDPDGDKYGDVRNFDLSQESEILDAIKAWPPCEFLALRQSLAEYRYVERLVVVVMLDHEKKNKKLKIFPKALREMMVKPHLPEDLDILLEAEKAKLVTSKVIASKEWDPKLNSLVKKYKAKLKLLVDPNIWKLVLLLIGNEILPDQGDALLKKMVEERNWKSKEKDRKDLSKKDRAREQRKARARRADISSRKSRYQSVVSWLKKRATAACLPQDFLFSDLQEINELCKIQDVTYCAKLSAESSNRWMIFQHAWVLSKRIQRQSHLGNSLYNFCTNIVLLLHHALEQYFAAISTIDEVGAELQDLIHLHQVESEIKRLVKIFAKETFATSPRHPTTSRCLELYFALRSQVADGNITMSREYILQRMEPFLDPDPWQIEVKLVL